VSDFSSFPPRGDALRLALLALVEGDVPAAASLLDLVAPQGDESVDHSSLVARLFWAQGQDQAARAVLGAALATGAPAALALASVALCDGPEHARRRLDSPEPGEQADAACDLALHSLRADDLAGAWRWLERAHQACPEHCETARWRRMLEEAGPSAPLLLRVEGPPPSARLLGDVWDLLPTPDRGWLAPERLLRRILAATDPGPDLVLAPADSALARLRQAGVTGRVFATEGDLAGLPAAHPLADLELRLDRVLSLEREERPLLAAAQGLWQQACALDAVACQDAAQALVTLGTRRPALGALALEAAGVLVEHAPREPLWRSYQATLAVQAGARPPALQAADAALGLEPLDSMSLFLLVPALRALGMGPVVQHLLERAHRQPELAELADWLEQDPLPAVQAVISDRLRSRFDDAAPAPR